MINIVVILNSDVQIASFKVISNGKVKYMFGEHFSHKNWSKTSERSEQPDV